MRRRLLRECKKAGTQKVWAMENDVSETHVCDVIKGKRGPGRKILEALGLRKREPEYEEVE